MAYRKGKKSFKRSYKKRMQSNGIRSDATGTVSQLGQAASGVAVFRGYDNKLCYACQ